MFQVNSQSIEPTNAVRGTASVAPPPPPRLPRSSNEETDANIAPRQDRRPRILYVEDDRDLTLVISAMMGSFADCEIAGSLGEAARLLLAEKYDLLIIDVILPDGSGIDLLRVLEASDSAKSPVVIFSSDEVRRDIRDRVAASLVKTRNSNEDLIESIKKLLGR